MTAERTPDARVEAAARAALDAWKKAEPDHPITEYPDSYVATFVDVACAALAAADAVQRAGLAERVAEALDREVVRAQHNASAGWDNEIVARAVVAAIYGARP